VATDVTVIQGNEWHSYVDRLAADGISAADMEAGGG
jgi:hypothetical protein